MKLNLAIILGVSNLHVTFECGNFFKLYMCIVVVVVVVVIVVVVDFT